MLINSIVIAIEILTVIVDLSSIIAADNLGVVIIYGGSSNCFFYTYFEIITNLYAAN